ncbi:hypothetical protein Mp_5g23640 [Marchantia polymorpha subsp. ruderalis]|uniref:Uncharacterized protein n=2 Tax=Marchantia polymorpha TaxID=3197 RepID=A0AAF6BLJ6_MARPO|nr:hypothetical protein MARPO_0010s0092 [Marchantia polymorpha]BBN12880.1 hypothetical protein Mp_5g23640 [Marchantia polymorpha subsp. ruderalis]|eukprot:PTQ46694.1 hypothetical protein MARPO_0010s0092 [Marchantia polymorpha]
MSGTVLATAITFRVDPACFGGPQVDNFCGRSAARRGNFLFEVVLVLGCRPVPSLQCVLPFSSRFCVDTCSWVCQCEGWARRSGGQPASESQSPPSHPIVRFWGPASKVTMLT